jgi:hypothetical protein
MLVLPVRNPRPAAVGIERAGARARDFGHSCRRCRPRRAPVVNRTPAIDRLQAAEDDSGDLEETYEIDLGDLTDDEPLGTGAGLTRDTVWQTGSVGQPDASLQAYDINVDELFADADMGLAKGVAPALGGRSTRTSEFHLDAPITEPIPAASTHTSIKSSVEADSAHSATGCRCIRGGRHLAPAASSGQPTMRTVDNDRFKPERVAVERGSGSDSSLWD